MTLYALDDLDDALDATREFLLPLDASLWFKLALISLFVGGPGANISGLQGSAGGNADFEPPPGDLPEFVLTPEFWVVVSVVVLGVLLFVLAFVLVSSVMEFVLVESLRGQRVRLRADGRRRWRQGVRLFGFRLALGVVLLVGGALVVGPLVAAAAGSGTAVGGSVAVVALLLAPVLAVLGVVVVLVDGFTKAFVVPVMILEGGGVLAGWRRLWPTVTANWRQYLAYVVVAIVLNIVGGILVGVVTAILVVLVAIPFFIVGALGVALFAIASPLGVAVVGVVGLVFFAAAVVVAALVQVPVVTYLRYYALLVLGDVEPAFDLVSEQRAAIRGDDSTAATE